MKRAAVHVFLITLLLAFCMNGNGQTIKNYDKEWKQVDELVKKNLPQSALVIVQKIYADAKSSKQDAQVIKTLIYMHTLQQENAENNVVATIKMIEKELPGANASSAAIMNNLLAQLYWSYYSAHRYQFYNRTTTVSFVKEDIATWSASDFHDRIGKLFLASLSNEKILQQTSLTAFSAIIFKGNSRQLRPTLYDLLAHSALRYFENDEHDLAKPAYAFQIDQASAFDPAADFIHRKFLTKDSASLYYQALLIYQELIRFHLKDQKSDALIDADIQRIEFVNRVSVHPDKEELYFNSINHVAHQYNQTPAASQAWYVVAQIYNQRASNYKPYADTSHRYDKLKAKAICEQVLMQKDSSEGKVNCFNLLQQLIAPTLSFQTEKVNLPGLPFRSSVETSNLTKIYCRVIKVNAALINQWEKRSDLERWKEILDTKTVYSWEQALPANTDLQQHRVEIKIDALPVGEYMAVMSSSAAFNNKQTVLAAQQLYVSAISFVNKGDKFFVLDRDNGKPLPSAFVQVWGRTYNNKTYEYEKQKLQNYTTNGDGYFQLAKTKSSSGSYINGNMLDISYKKDRLFMDDNLYSSYYYPDESTDEGSTNKMQKSIYFFGDRSIYRPGQMVYFKGIYISHSTSGSNNKIITNAKVTVYLRDANYQTIDTLKLTTNEFGSFTGNFKLPVGALNGNFTIVTEKESGSLGFKVEEYKRPKFAVEYPPLKTTYRVNDEITVTGTAKAYAGNSIDGATVKYRVRRQPRYIYYWGFSRYWQPPTTAMEIVNGEVTTDKDGKFIIKFKAIPDLSIDKKFNPVFDYVVSADVTDINGETRSGEQTVTVGYSSLMIVSNIPATAVADSLNSLNIQTQNMNGAHQSATLDIRIIRLQEESRLIRARFWERPDGFVLSKEEYVKLFPYDEYDNESDPASWKQQETAMATKDTASENGVFKLNGRKLIPGNYKIEISTRDKDGNVIKDEKYMVLTDADGHSPAGEYFTTTNSGAVEPGDTATLTVNTNADELYVIQETNRNKNYARNAGIEFDHFYLNNKAKALEFKANEEDRGGYGVSWVTVKHNRVYTKSQTIYVPWTNKDLTIEYGTYRDKTLPGSEEKWSVKISGAKKEKVAAEMLASMYDASLDQFYPHQWSAPYIWQSYYSYDSWQDNENFSAVTSEIKYAESQSYQYFEKSYDQLMFGANGYGVEALSGFIPGIQNDASGRVRRQAGAAQEVRLRGAATDMSDVVVLGYATASKDAEKKINNAAPAPPMVADSMNFKLEGIDAPIQIRKNFNETAFFIPDLHTDKDGNISFSFTLPDALTKWKFQGLAHTKDLAFGYTQTEIITQKQLMVQPNAPRFIREADQMTFSSKVVNTSDKTLSGLATLQLFDAVTNEPIDGLFKNTITQQSFTINAGESSVVNFPISIPTSFNNAVTWKIVAKANEFSDGEENTLPVLSNRLLVTESITLPMKGNGEKHFVFEKLKNSGSSSTLTNQSLTIEFTSNPSWLAVQSLPYLIEYPYECAEQTWNRYYANSLASSIINSAPKFRQVFEKWRNEDTSALLSNLQKNEELKSILLEETPWVLQAKTESQQKKNLALLFDLAKMSAQLNSSINKLQELQNSNGGFTWFKGGPDDRYMTQYIITGIGHLKKLKAISAAQDARLTAILNKAIPYLDAMIKREYDELIRYKTDMKKYTPGYYEIQYFYMRSFFPERKVAAASQVAYNYYRERLTLAWMSQNKYMQGMTSLALFRGGDINTPKAILKSLKETSITNEELGMYWKDAGRSWWWYEAPIERQALLIEAFQEIEKNTEVVDALKTWLLKNKQTNNWESTKATAEACYALLLQGSQWITAEPVVVINAGSYVIDSKNEKAEAGTGYIKKTIAGKDVTASMGDISVNVSNTNTISWGAVHWQYFENMDKITSAATPLQLKKQLFVETNGARGPVLSPVITNASLKIGDKIRVRIELRVDRDMEYVHMKDLRAAAMEPVNVLSGYKWQDGLGYYESTKDASTNFFFSYLRKGTYVFEYPLFVTHSGNFSNGITSIQCMYAPEFNAHSEGIRVNIK